MKKSRITALILSAVVAMGSISGCSTPAAKTTNAGSAASAAAASGSASSSSGGKVFRTSMITEPPTLDPQMANSMIATTIDNELFDGLLRNDSGKLEPAGADSYTVSEDGLTYTFKLNKDVKWSDGKGIVAADYEYGMKRLLDPKTASPYAFAGEILKNGVAVEKGKKPVSDLGVKAIDDYTLQITLESPCAYFPEEVTTASYLPVRKDLVEKYGKDFAAAPDKNVYNGPFVLKSWAHGSKMVLTKNDKYKNASSVKLDEADISFIADENTAVGMYESGQLDYVELPDTMAAQYPEAKSYMTGSVRYLQFNMKSAPVLANKNFRMAMNYAIDREGFVKLATNGISLPQTRFVLPEVNSAENGKTYGEAYDYSPFGKNADTAKAKDCLNKALKELGKSSPSSISIELSCTDEAKNVKCAEVIQSQLQTALGIKISIKQVPYKQLYENLDKNDFQMMYTGWSPDYPDPNTYLNLWMTDNAYNHTFYNNKDYDKLMTDANNNLDPKKRMDMLFSAEKKFCDDVVAIPMALIQKKYLINPKVKNLGCTSLVTTTITAI